MNCELPDVQAGFRKGRGTRDQIANICWIIKKAREFQKNIYFCFIDYAKAFDCVDHHTLWKILKEMGIPDLPLEKSVCRSGRQQLELDMELQTGSNCCFLTCTQVSQEAGQVVWYSHLSEFSTVYCDQRLWHSQ